MADQDSSTEALGVLRRIEPTLARIDGRSINHDERLARLEAQGIDHDQQLARIEAALPLLTTKEELKRHPTRSGVWWMLAVVVALPALVGLILTAGAVALRRRKAAVSDHEPNNAELLAAVNALGNELGSRLDGLCSLDRRPIVSDLGSEWSASNSTPAGSASIYPPAPGEKIRARSASTPIRGLPNAGSKFCLGTDNDGLGIRLCYRCQLYSWLLR